ncbi:MAG: DUF4465 domain-containing protein [Planctomycetaceae bacterium]|nr:DUF4465 domain-containing protein [Planctomycetaceae bacterium]MCP4463934.1 DUF4465 domain-containing protein [Planctomycetaceae bacterium]MDG1808240.1 DUF4465 domain-containing protein [Pirellulaceae bacterium]MDG2103550.1 DUF4465 domain-containing protein [Pirellulaceae bacterium]
MNLLKTDRSLALAMVIICLASMAFLPSTSAVLQAEIVDFEELNLNPNSFFDGYGGNAQSGTWTSGSATFNTNLFGPGWSYSNVNDSTTAGFTNQWAAYPGTGFGGSGNYALANTFSPNGAYINLSQSIAPIEVQVSNSTYAALSMRDGDGFGKKFGGDTGNDEDFFTVTFTGFSGLDKTGSETGRVDFYLADYRFSDNSQDYIIADWNAVDLSALGTVQSVAIGLASSDNGQFGMNTPSYVAIDSLRFNSVPEPSGFILVPLGCVALLRRSRRR